MPPNSKSLHGIFSQKYLKSLLTFQVTFRIETILKGEHLIGSMKHIRLKYWISEDTNFEFDPTKSGTLFAQFFKI